MFKDRLTSDGREIANQDAMSLPAGWDRPLTLEEQIQKFVRVELARRAADTGFETFEEADDFDVSDEDGEFHSPYEVLEMTPEDGQEDAAPPVKGGSSAPPSPTAPEAPKPAAAAGGDAGSAA